MRAEAAAAPRPGNPPGRLRGGAQKV